jgi:hypothetical protein
MRTSAMARARSVAHKGVMKLPRYVLHRLALSSLPILAACYSEVPNDVPAETRVEFDEVETLARVREYMSNRVKRVTTRPFRSEAVDGWISLFVSEESVETYLRVREDKLPLREGALVVREVLDSNLKVTRLTVIAKGPQGYNPEVGDFWFAVTDPAGNVLDKDGTRQAGALPSCAGCHIGKKDQAFLFGISPAAEESPDDARPSHPADSTVDAGADSSSTPRDAATSTCSGELLINELQTEGSSASDEFIELYNPTACAVSLTGYRLEYYSRTGTSADVYFSATAGMALAPQGYFVLGGNGFGGASSAPIAGGLATLGGRLVLRNRAGQIADAVGWGAASGVGVEGGPALAAPKGSSLGRSSTSADSGDNASDFRTQLPTPGALNR